MRRIVWMCLLALTLAVPALAEPLTIAAGAGYKKPVTELAKAFETASGMKTELIFGNMGQVATQAKSSGAVDVIVGEKGFLESMGLPIDSLSPLGRGVLVVAWPKGNGLAAPADIAKPSVARLAMPDPAKAIYGKAASQYLEKSGLDKVVAGKLLVVATVPQVTAYLQSGEVDAGFVNRTDVLDAGASIGGFLEIDPSQYAPIEIVAVSLGGAKNTAGAKAFAAFLTSPEARGIIGRHGL
ncbi:Molybdenum ABC transporter, periplasmic molybdenum-binding protein ModA [Desulfovibrio sp. DV]|uniref:molybdate ABC transporter substrate-binding protein n=1 Tax=Desulfovibrio sp. DV TaxID=1844708 RepID=UPI00094BC3E8|nr:molybdate ABC transporter substrate-binding protein [Desulfovibrio sp. DV]OLN25299.1 Molybdenum ABC transporter, periplasmic molybdenum-binding protein ModA [Desulfovibrio sp. DV]